jgi:NAD+ diphosphatase
MGGWKRVCRNCRREEFPRTDPVVIMLVTDGSRCVLGRERHFAERMYSALAGFVEPGEDIEHAVRRETKEEVGLEIGAVRFALSQPWPFPHSLMIGCMAKAEPHPLVVSTAELEAARWFSRGEVQQMLAGEHPEGLSLPGPHAIAHALVNRWLTSG